MSGDHNMYGTDMTLPPLPEHTIDYMKNVKAYTAQQMRSYGQQCRKAALHDAADLAHCIAMSHLGTALECEAKLRSLK